MKQQGWRRVVKGICDRVVALCLLILVSPLWVWIVVWIRRDSPGPALYRQTRAGLAGKPFTIYKFRSMVQNADAVTRERLAALTDLTDFVFQEPDDPRITRSGRFLRRTSMDELPQLLNIVKGDLSLVGPRPEVAEIVEKYTPEQRRRLCVQQGVTGWAQVNGRSELTLSATLRYDLEYVERWSLLFDLRILWRTVRVVWTGRGAY
ncbi:MAG: sugar transferase [Peptococcaceae bacterium]|nr:sugar transferase [Peptococcaceae bacterium]